MTTIAQEHLIYIVERHAKALQTIDDICPDVGMGRLWKDYVDAALKEFALTEHVTVSEYEKMIQKGRPQRVFP